MTPVAWNAFYRFEFLQISSVTHANGRVFIYPQWCEEWLSFTDSGAHIAVVCSFLYVEDHATPNEIVISRCCKEGCAMTRCWIKGMSGVVILHGFLADSVARALAYPPLAQHTDKQLGYKLFPCEEYASGSSLLPRTSKKTLSQAVSVSLPAHIRALGLPRWLDFSPICVYSTVQKKSSIQTTPSLHSQEQYLNSLSFQITWQRLKCTRVFSIHHQTTLCISIIQSNVFLLGCRRVCSSV